MTRLANEKGVLAVCGTQALGSPEIAYASQLVADGYVGQVLSTTIIGRGRGWGATIPLQQTAYVLDNRNGASMLTIPFGHTLAALREILGEVAEVGAILVNRRTEAKALDTGVVVPMTAHDQVLVAGLMASGAPLSMHYRGGDARDGKGLLWQINGAEGDLQLEAPSGHSQQAAFVLSGGRGSDKSIKPLATPPSLPEVGPADPLTGNVARIYARMASDLHTGTRTAPRFSDALEIHKIITAIEESARSGQRVRVE
jgi:predicted dehydrogenase